MGKFKNHYHDEICAAIEIEQLKVEGESEKRFLELLASEAHRSTYTAEQIRLFEQLYSKEFSDKTLGELKAKMWLMIDARDATPVQPLRSLASMLDYVPVPKLRKRLKKLLADQSHHILELHAQGRLKAAQWIGVCTWALCLWYVLKSPLDSLLSLVRKSSGA